MQFGICVRVCVKEPASQLCLKKGRVTAALAAICWKFAGLNLSGTLQSTAHPTIASTPILGHMPHWLAHAALTTLFCANSDPSTLLTMPYPSDIFTARAVVCMLVFVKQLKREPMLAQPRSTPVHAGCVGAHGHCHASYNLC